VQLEMVLRCAETIRPQGEPMTVREDLEREADRQIAAAETRRRTDPEGAHAATHEAEELLADLRNGRMTPGITAAILKLKSRDAA
jgi:hypothetical protein